MVLRTFLMWVEDGLVAGWIMEKTRTGQRKVWFWTLTVPVYPFKMSHGEEETHEAARDAFKALFSEWHEWALKQPGNVTWYGDD